VAVLTLSDILGNLFPFNTYVRRFDRWALRRAATHLSQGGDQVHPKVQAGATAASVIAALVAVLSLVGVQVDGDLQQAVAVIVAAVIPVIAGYLKSA
jgi:hypothetical protein